MIDLECGNDVKSFAERRKVLPVSIFYHPYLLIHLSLANYLASDQGEGNKTCRRKVCPEDY